MSHYYSPKTTKIVILNTIKKSVRMHILLTACQHGKLNLGLRTILLFFITSDFYIHCCAKQNCPPAKISPDATADGEKSMDRKHIF